MLIHAGLLHLVAVIILGDLQGQGADCKKLVGFWGRKVSAIPEKGYQEKALKDYCAGTPYDILSIGYLDIFFDGRNTGDLPHFDFSTHCTTPNKPSLPHLLKCPLIGDQITQCQRAGTKILLTIGGPTTDATFQSSAKARQFAATVWNLVLGGTKQRDYRIFGSATLDGVVLDFQAGWVKYQPDFVRELRQLMDGDSSRRYMIAVNPYCVYPDAFLGPAPGTILGEVPYLVDAMFVQYMNSQCRADNSKQFWNNVKQWTTRAHGVKFFLGLPAHPRATEFASDYRAPKEVAEIYRKLRTNPKFDGFTIWDVSFDGLNLIDGKRYSEHVGTLLSGRKTSSPTTRPIPPSESTSEAEPFSCSGKVDGNYQHQTDCAKYYVCTQGIRSELSCPPGLKFNAKMNTCDWPANATCP